MNQITLIGRLTKKPELKNTKNGKSVCDFSLAVNRNYVKEDGTKDVDFIICQVWNKTSENLCKYQDKGSQLAIIGELRVEKYTNQKGEEVYKTYVFANTIEYLSTKTTESTKAVVEEKTNQDQEYIDFGNAIELTDDDVAF